MSTSGYIHVQYAENRHSIHIMIAFDCYHHAHISRLGQVGPTMYKQVWQRSILDYVTSCEHYGVLTLLNAVDNISGVF